MITLDASAAIKLIIHEENSDVAARLFYEATETGEPIVAPDILLPETMNVLWKHLVLLRDISSAQFDIAVDNFRAVWDNLVVISTNSVLKESIKVSKEQKISFYDAVYAAISISEDAPLFTFDKNITDKCMKIGLKSYNSAL
jgi:predicted nucleic acid-binding protein